MAKRILVVEDQEDNRQILRDLLANAGYDMIEAEDGEQGVAAANNERPDLILMDIQLPGMDGLTLTRRLKADPATADIPVVGLSAHALQRDVELAYSAGCVDYITKPITDDPFTFLERVAHSLPRSVEPGTAPARP